MWQVEPPVQVTLPFAPKVNEQVELPLHEALPLEPKVRVQVEPPVQLGLQDWSQLPVQVV